jgi:hypothetical protein
MLGQYLDYAKTMSFQILSNSSLIYHKTWVLYLHTAVFLHGETESLGTVSSDGPTVPAPDEMLTGRGNWSAWRKACPITTLYTTNLIWTILGLKPGLNNEKPVSTCLSYDKAWFVHTITKLTCLQHTSPNVCIVYIHAYLYICINKRNLDKNTKKMHHRICYMISLALLEYLSSFRWINVSSFNGSICVYHGQHL